MNPVRPLAASLVISAGLAGAQQPAQGPDQAPDQNLGELDQAILDRYDGYRVIRVTHRDQAELDRFQTFNLRLMSEREGVGPVHYLVPPQVFDRLINLGLEIEVIDEAVAVEIGRERARLGSNNLRFNRASFFDDFRVFEDPAGQDVVDITDFIDSLAQQHPDLISIETVGTSIQNRPIRGITITAPNNGPASQKPLIFINAGIHAREWLSPTTALYIIDQLTSRYGSDSRVTRILDQAVFFVIPVSNPDGYTYTHTTNRFWRKNRRQNNNGTFGVDLNRNFGFRWGGLGASSSPDSDTYRGPAPFSEPESRAIRDAALARPNTSIFVDVHTYSQLILFPWGYDVELPPEPVQSDFFDLSNGIRDAIRGSGDVEYSPIPSHQLYPASGVLGDWGYGGLGALAWTFELRPAGGPNVGLSGFAPMPDQIIPTGEEILEAFLYLADLSVDGVTLSLVEDAPESLSTAEPTPITFRAVPVLPTDVDTTSARVMYRTAGSNSFTPLPAEPNDFGRFVAPLPAVACGTETEYYFEVSDSRGVAYTLPRAAPNEFFSAPAQDRVTIFSDDASLDMGWTSTGTASSGFWERGVAARGNRTDPPSDVDGSGWAFLTENTAGDTDVDDGVVVLLSPQLDTTQGGQISYAYWINSNSTPTLDTSDGLFVEYEDGNAWRQVRAYTTANDRWLRDELTIGQDIPAQADLRLRFVASDLSNPNIVEAGIDAFRYTRTQPCSSPCLADVNGDGAVNGLDFGAWLSAFNANAPAADQNADGLINGLDFGAWLANFNAGCP